MPLDGHAHLVRQGWSGKGNGLRHGAITKPVTVVQKKTLAGIGKDRDEAFPFWDHVFQAASVSIQLKLHDSDDESDTEGGSESATPALELKRTSTGIISNRRPTTGTPALSGATTPSDSVTSARASGSSTPRLNIMAAAKQQAARRLLYSMFYRGPVLATEDEQTKSEETDGGFGPSVASASASSTAHNEESDEVDVPKSRKRKSVKEQDGDPDADKRERKRRRKEGEERSKTAKGKERAGEESTTDAESGEEAADEVQDAKAARKAEKAERKRLREEKRARKLVRRKRRAERQARADEDDPDGEKGKDAVPPAPGSKGLTVVASASDPASLGPAKKAKKLKRTSE